MEELGIDRPTLTFLIAGLALQPDDGVRLADLFNPYATVLDQWDAPAATARGAGLAEEIGSLWRLSPKGRALARHVRAEADAFLATLEPIPASDITRLAATLGSALAAIEASDVPHEHMLRTPRFRGDPSVPMVALENALFGLWQARDDCHMASWRRRGFDGPTFDVLTRLWRHEAAIEHDLAARLSQQRPDDVRAALGRLRAEGLVEEDDLAVTATGASVRQAIEDETDQGFFGPWPEDLGTEAEWIRERLATLNARLAAAS